MPRLQLEMKPRCQCEQVAICWIAFGEFLCINTDEWGCSTAQIITALHSTVCSLGLGSSCSLVLTLFKNYRCTSVWHTHIFCIFWSWICSSLGCGRVGVWGCGVKWCQRLRGFKCSTGGLGKTRRWFHQCCVSEESLWLHLTFVHKYHPYIYSV